MKHHFGIKGQFEAYASSQTEVISDPDRLITLQASGLAVVALLFQFKTPSSSRLLSGSSYSCCIPNLHALVHI
jgi:hypothetical protein